MINRLLQFSILTALLLFFGCVLKEAPQKHRIGFSQCCDDPWRDVMNSEMGRELGFHPELEFEIRVAGGDSEKQIEQIRELVKTGIDILLVSPNEAKPLTPILEEVYKAGIPVVLIDRKTDSDLYTAYIGADNFEIGETAGKYLAGKFNGTGKVIEIQLPMTMSPAVERHEGFRKALLFSPGIEVVDVLETKNGLDDINTRFPELLQRHPDAVIVFGHTDLISETAYKIAAEQGRAADMCFIGIDGIPGTGRGIQAVEDGILDASMLYPTGGAEAIQLATAVLNNLPYEKQNTLQTIVINKDNARIMHNQMKKVNALQKSIDDQIEVLESLRIIYRNQRMYILFLLSTLLLALVLGIFLWRSLQTKKAANQSLEQKNQEILEHEKQIMAMSEEVREATQTKVDFFTNISHEFRTPLTLILGFAEDLLPSPKLSRDMQQSIGHIRQNAYRLLRLVNQLMDFRKTESNKMQLRASENDLVAFVRNIIESYAKTAQKRNIDLQLFARQEHLPVWFDTSMMDKVLFNLLSNAFKFTPNGGKIYLYIAADNFEHTAKLSIEDTGKGMSEEEVQHVFEAFYQASEGHQPGTGLGLSLSKTLIDLHGGNINLQSTKGKGSRFTVSIPLGKEHLKPNQLILDKEQVALSEAFLMVPETDLFEPSDMPESTSGSRQILIIEDNEDLQHFLHKKLGTYYQVFSATDGNEGLQKALESTPDLIISDIMLPGKNGLEITRTLKSDLRTSHIPILLLSAQSSIEQQIEGAGTGADAYMTKPFNIQLLQATLKSLLLNRQVMKESFSKGLVSYTTQLQQTEISAATNPLDRDFIHRFTAFIDRHFAEQDFRVDVLCKEFGLSRSQLYRKVTALLGIGINDFIQNVRLKKAEELLLEERLTVAEIAYQVGFSSPDYFSTVFKSKYDIAPSQFKKQYLEKGK